MTPLLRIEYADGKALVITPGFYDHGASERAELHIVGVHRLDSLAPVLYDPKRVMASGAGVAIRNPAAEVRAAAEALRAVRPR